MARGGYRPGAGRPKGSRNKERRPESPTLPNDGKIRTPLEYMLDVMNDPTVDSARRDRMAIAAAPYEHTKAPEDGKKKELEKAAEEAGAGKFAPSAPPLRAVK